MPKSKQIQCINKSQRANPYERILTVGGVDESGKRWSMTVDEVVRLIERGQKFNVLVKQLEVDVIVAESRFGNKYIKTKDDGESPDNLLALAECPSK